MSRFVAKLFANKTIFNRHFGNAKEKMIERSLIVIWSINMFWKIGWINTSNHLAISDFLHIFRKQKFLSFIFSQLAVFVHSCIRKILAMATLRSLRVAMAKTLNYLSIMSATAPYKTNVEIAVRRVSGFVTGNSRHALRKQFLTSSGKRVEKNRWNTVHNN